MGNSGRIEEKKDWEINLLFKKRTIKHGKRLLSNTISIYYYLHSSSYRTYETCINKKTAGYSHILLLLSKYFIKIKYN